MKLSIQRRQVKQELLRPKPPMVVAKLLYNIRVMYTKLS